MQKKRLGSFDVDGDGEIDLFETALAFAGMEDSENNENSDEDFWSEQSDIDIPEDAEN